MEDVYIETLGCPKNQVDSDYIKALFLGNNYNITDNPENAHIIVVNTCTFIEDAKKESIDKIFDLLPYKEYGKCRKIIVSGCMAQRYKNLIDKELPEIDAFYGVENFQDFISTIDKKGNFVKDIINEYQEYNIDRYTDNSYAYEYVKIAEGCNHKCSFCSIPLFKGKYKSRKIENIIKEIEYLVNKKNKKEIILISQDNMQYGYDLYNKFSLFDLLDQIEKTENLKWVRLLYLNPFDITTDIIDKFFSYKKLVKYFDIPFQSFSPNILKLMKRKYDIEQYKNIIKYIKQKDEFASVRTTLIIGFPGETKKDFEKNIELVNELKFNRLGLFKYSPEEDTDIVNNKNLEIPEDDIVLERMNFLMEKQLEISRNNLKKYVNKELNVLIEQYDKNNIYFGRTEYDAPDIDGMVYVESEKKLKQGDIVKVNITTNNDHDLQGVVI